MSTTYYALRSPVAQVGAWLTLHSLYNDTGRQVGLLAADCLHFIADRDEKVAHRSGGTITVYATGPDTQQAVSEHGELVTLGELRRGVAP